MKLRTVTLPSPGLTSTKYPCTNPYYVYGKCNSGHYSKKVTVRCRKCVICRKYRQARFLAQSFQRSEHAMSRIPYIRRRVINMWTLGTNLKDTKVNRKAVVRYLQLWKKRIRIHYHRARKNPLQMFVWVLETGDSGYLHFHTIIAGYLPHKYARSVWSNVTGIDNPNFRYDRARKSLKSFLAYAGKYMSKIDATSGKSYSKVPYIHLKQLKYSNHLKEPSNLKQDLIKYSWMGKFIGLPKRDPKKPLCYICSVEYEKYIFDWQYNVQFQYIHEIDDFFDEAPATLVPGAQLSN